MQQTPPKKTRWLWLAAAAIAVAGPSQAASSLPVLETKDKVQARVGVFVGGSVFTPAGGGHTGQATDYAVDFGMGTGPVRVQDGAFLNQASVNDEMTFAFWTKKYDTVNSSAFWGLSPSSNEGGRGFQAHVPWSDGNIYFDTAGCCDAATQRVVAPITDFADYTGDATWWTDNWHFFVFSKKGEVKEIWIDGILFFPNWTTGTSTAPLPTDFTELFIGAQGPGSINPVHGLVDDFAVFGTALSEATIAQLYTGTLPTALPATDKLLAFWDFNDFPAEGMFLSFSPTPDAAAAAPDLVQVVHIDGATPWTESNVSLKVDDAAAPITLTRDGTKVTVKHVPNPLLSMQSKHKAALTYPGADGPKTVEWEFTVGPYTRDVVASRVGVFRGGSSYTSDAGGRSAQAGDRAVDFGRGTGPVHVADGSFLNQASVNDDMTFAVWIKEYDNANNSAFWANSPSSSGTQRGWQAHVPNGNTIYFDTAGCCDGATQRLSAGIATFPGYTDLPWWNDWHLFVFSKQADWKQVWIDGELFLEGSNTGVLPTDFTDLFIGSDGAGGSLMHGIMDDFAVFGTALDAAAIGQLFSGTLPSALPASAELLAYWNFNDVPPDGLFVSFTPAPDATAAVPNSIMVVHLDGTAPWDLTKVGLKVDGATVTPAVVRDGSVVTVSYVPSPIFEQKSTHTATLIYPVGASLAERSWTFTVGMYTKDVLHQYLGVLTGPATFTPDAGGQSGQPGDYAIDFGRNNARQSVTIPDASFLNQAAPNDEFSIVAWQKLYAIADSALFWGVSPSSSGTQRGIGTHAPWSNNNLYFDTAGCCDGATQRTTAAMTVDTFPDYSGAVDWWYSWRHLVFQKKLDVKEIWIDGKLFITGYNTGVLPNDFTVGYLGFDPPDGATMRGLVDEFAVFKTSLSEEDILKLAAGQAPNTLPAATGILAYWNFNDPPAPPVEDVTLIVTRSGGNVTVTSNPQPLPAGFVLQLAPSVNGPWTTQPGANTPVTVPIGTEAAVFLRAAKP